MERLIPGSYSFVSFIRLVGKLPQEKRIFLKSEICQEMSARPGTSQF